MTIALIVRSLAPRLIETGAAGARIGFDDIERTLLRDESILGMKPLFGEG